MPAAHTRDAVATRDRILDAAIAEFSRYGIAGARVDRVAAAAGANKSLIYQYIGNKDHLFDAVFETIVVRTIDEVPIDGSDLAGYAARLFDAHITRPEPMRIGRWDELERDGAGLRSPAVLQAMTAKTKVVAAAQRSGLVNDQLPPGVLLEMVIALSRTGPIDTHPPPTRRVRAAHRAHIISAVQQLVTPQQQPEAPV